MANEFGLEPGQIPKVHYTIGTLTVATPSFPPRFIHEGYSSEDKTRLFAYLQETHTVEMDLSNSS